MSMIVFPKALVADDTVPQYVTSPKGELIQKTYQIAENYDVSPKLMVSLINCENNDWDTTLQSKIVKKGVREKSYGLAQINLPANKDVTKEQATNPDFALDFMASNIAKGKANMWSCYKIIKNKKNVS